MEHQPDFEELRVLRVLVGDAFIEAAVTGRYLATFGRYRVWAVRQSRPRHHPGSVQVAVEIIERPSRPAASDGDEERDALFPSPDHRQKERRRLAHWGVSAEVWKANGLLSVNRNNLLDPRIIATRAMS